MDSVKVSQDMERAIAALGREGELSLDLIKNKAKAMAEYDKVLGVAIGVKKADGMAVSIIDKTCKGEVSEYLYRKIIAEESLKAHYSRMEQLKAQLNGLQSMNRFLEYKV